MVFQYIRADSPWVASKEVEVLGVSSVEGTGEVETRQAVMQIAAS